MNRRPIVTTLPGTEGVLDDARGFYVQASTRCRGCTAFVGKNLAGQLVYVEYFFNRGDAIEIVYMRPANREEREFYGQT